MKNILIFILALGLFACKQDPDPTIPPTGCGMTIDQFPLKVGNSWTYQVFQSVDGGEPYQFLEKIKVNLINLNNTDYTLEYIYFIDGDTSDYSVNKFSIEENRIIPFFSFRSNYSEGFINFPLICTNNEEIEKFNESDTLFSKIIKESFAIKDTIFRIKNKDIKAVKCLRYEQTKILEIDYYNINVFQYVFISPNIGIIQTEMKGFNYYPFSANFNYLYKLIDYKIL